jgi:drug/metabolite transporter (DMT)-like permease
MLNKSKTESVFFFRKLIILHQIINIKIMSSTVKAYIALGLVCFFWGTTYLAARIGVAGFPALIFMGIRNVLAGSLLLGFLALRGSAAKWTWTDIKLQIIPGLCMITFGTGIVGWAVKYIPSGLAALLCSMIPVLTIMINLAVRKDQKINWQIFAGMLLGLVGVTLIFGDNLDLVNNPQTLTGIVVVLVSVVSWCCGGLYTQIYKSKSDSFFNAGVQMFAGGVGLFVLSAFNEDWSHLPAMNITSLAALVYLIFFGSILAFASYLYAMSKLPAGLVSIYAYINPLVAILLGFLILGEKITWYTVLAFIVTMSGVYMVSFGYKVQKKKLEIV